MEEERVGINGRREQKFKSTQNPEGINSRKEKKKMTEGPRKGGRREPGEQESVFPVFLDGEAPFPGEVVVFVVVGELGLDAVGAAGKHPFGRLLRGGNELVLLCFGTVAPNHVFRFVNCALGRERKGELGGASRRYHAHPDSRYSVSASTSCSLIFTA